jgi:hypothetical protein
MTKFAITVANAQLPTGSPNSEPFVLKRMTENQGTLSDSSISYLITQNTLPSFPVEAEYDLFPSQNEDIAYWHPTKDFAEAWVQFHHIQASYLPPLKPLNLVAQTLAYDKIQVSWSNTPINETGFIIQRKTGSGMFQSIDTVPANTLQFVDTGLIGNTLYHYRTYAWNSDGVSAFSNQDSTETFLTAVRSSAKTKKTTILYVSGHELRVKDHGFEIDQIEIISLEGKRLKTFSGNEDWYLLPPGLAKGFYLLRIRFTNQPSQIETLLLDEL